MKASKLICICFIAISLIMSASLLGLESQNSYAALRSPIKPTGNADTDMATLQAEIDAASPFDIIQLDYKNEAGDTISWYYGRTLPAPKNATIYASPTSIGFDFQNYIIALLYPSLSNEDFIFINKPLTIRGLGTDENDDPLCIFDDPTFNEALGMQGGPPNYEPLQVHNPAFYLSSAPSSPWGKIRFENIKFTHSLGIFGIFAPFELDGCVFEFIGNPIWPFVGALSVYPNLNSDDPETKWDNPVKSKVVNCDFIKCGNIGYFFGCCEFEFAYNNYLGGNQWWMVESGPGVYDSDHVNLWLTGINSVYGLTNDQLNISYCRNNLIHDNVYDGANPALRPDGPDYDCFEYILFLAGAGSGGTMENIRVFNNTFRNQRNDVTTTIGFASWNGAHAEDVSIYANTIQDIRAGRYGIYAETPPFYMGSSKDISIVDNTFSSDETAEIFNGIFAAWMSHTLIARNNYKNGNYLSFDTVISDPALDIFRMPVLLAFCENCIVNEVGGFPSGESGQVLNWIVDFEGINNRIVGLAATPEEVPPGIGAMLSDQIKAHTDLLKHIR